MTPILSICIPTYNRKNYLIENLEVLMPQIQEAGDKVEILINDNASSDETFEVLSSHCIDKKWEIDLKRNNENIYITDNFKDVVARAKGKYIYLMGDDDIVSPDFIRIILPILQNGTYSIIHFNRLSGDDKCSNNHLHDREFKSLKEDLSFDVFISRVMSSPNFISSMIFAKNIWDRGEAYYKKDRYYGYEFLSRILFPAIGTRCLYYYMPLVLMRNPLRTWSQNGFLYTMIGMYHIFEDLDELIPGVKNRWIKRTRNTHFYDFAMSLSDIGRYPAIYRSHRSEIMKICINNRERLATKLLLDFPIRGLTPKIYVKLLKIWRLSRRRYRLDRKVEN